jgi:hypothetical protein
VAEGAAHTEAAVGREVADVHTAVAVRREAERMVAVGRMEDAEDTGAGRTAVAAASRRIPDRRNPAAAAAAGHRFEGEAGHVRDSPRVEGHEIGSRQDRPLDTGHQPEKWVRAGYSWGSVSTAVRMVESRFQVERGRQKDSGWRGPRRGPAWSRYLECELETTRSPPLCHGRLAQAYRRGYGSDRDHQRLCSIGPGSV